MADRYASYYDAPPGGPLDEDAMPRLAAAMATVTNPIPVGSVERPLARAGSVAWRAGILFILAFLPYVTVLAAPTLLDGEKEAFDHQPAVRAVDWEAAPKILLGQPTRAAPPVLRTVLRSEAWLRSGVTTHHAAGVTLHAAVTVVLWLVLRRLNRPGGWLAAALFAVNPGSVAAVVWLHSRGRPWGALLGLLAVWLLLRGTGVPKFEHLGAAEYDPDEEPRSFWQWLSPVVSGALALLGLIVFAAATQCQPAVAVLAGVTIALVAWRRGLRLLDLLWIVPLLALAVGPTAAAFRATPPADRDPAVTALSVPMQGLWWTGRALQRIAWPLSTADLASAGSHGQVMATCGLGGGLLLLVIASLLLRRTLGGALAAAGVCFVLLLPTLIVPPAVRPLTGLTAARQAMAAATYLLAVPVLAVVADGLFAIASRLARADFGRRIAEASVAAAAVVFVAVVAGVRAHAFADTETVLKTAVRANGQAWADRDRLAEWYLAQKRPSAALDVLAGLTLESCPDATTAVAQGDLLVANHELPRAMEWYRRAIELDPTDPKPVGRESAVLVGMDRVGDAVDAYEQALKKHPESAMLHGDFGQLLLRLNNLPLAEKQYRRAIALDPEGASYHVALGTILAQTGQLTDAALELQEAVRIDPENFDAFHDAGLILFQLEAYEQSARMLIAAVTLQPDSVAARSDLAVDLIRWGMKDRDQRKLKRAEFELKEALKLQPDSETAQRNLATCQKLLGQMQRRSSIEGK